MTINRTETRARRGDKRGTSREERSASGKEARIERVCGRRTGTSEQAAQKTTGIHAEKGVRKEEVRHAPVHERTCVVARRRCGT